MTVQTIYHADGRELTVVRVQDVQPILEHNAVLRTMEQRSDWGRHRASVPNVVLEKWLNEAAERGHIMQFGSDEFYEMVERKLNDPDNYKFRTDTANAFLGFGS